MGRISRWCKRYNARIVLGNTPKIIFNGQATKRAMASAAPIVRRLKKGFVNG